MMTKSRYDPQRHHRRSIRLKGYDYAQAGAYFVTIVCQHRLCLLEPAPVCDMIQSWWDKLPEKFPTVETDAFVIMPNHIHGIIVITEPELGLGQEGQGQGGQERQEQGGQERQEQGGQTRGSAPTPDVNVGAHPRVRPESGVRPESTLGHIVQWFKTMTTNAYIRGVKQDRWEPFPGKLWQRNYYERIIRNERELNATRQYIHDNPAQWENDNENPNRRR
ncbi:MAG: transposase [Chloroflexota bacterium]|nr:transposase [Chloroflexota bacterium]